MRSSTPNGLPEPVAAMRRFNRASVLFDEADAVHQLARERLFERLQLLKFEPSIVIDLGAATGKASVDLAAEFPKAQTFAIDRSLAMLAKAKTRRGADGLFTVLAGCAENLPFSNKTVDLIFANLLLPWCVPDLFFAEAARVLREDGLLSFSTVGPDTLIEVRRAWASVDDAIHVHGFVDMHDIGDLALRAGLTEPVMDVDRIKVTYKDVGSFVADVRACGAGNVAAGRRATFTSRGRWAAFGDALESMRRDGRFVLTVELIFGQVWGRSRIEDRSKGTAEATYPLAKMRRQLGHD